MPKKSMIWNHFRKEDNCTATCLECDENVPNRKGNTTCLISHLKSKHVDRFVNFESKSLEANQSNKTQRERQRSDSDSSDSSSTPKRPRIVATPGSYHLSGAGPSTSTSVPAKNRRPSKQQLPKWPKDNPTNKQIDTEIVKWVINQSLPFKVIDSEGFNSILSIATQGRYNGFSASTLSRDRIPKLFLFVKEHVMEMVESEKDSLDGVAFTSDIWTTDHNNLSFQSLTMHFITKKFELKRLLVKLEYFPEKHSAENIMEKLDFLIKGLKLEANTHTWATTDGGAPILKAMRLSKASSFRSLNDSLWCVDHLIHLIVTDALKQVNNIYLINQFTFFYNKLR
jgi:BED zinc finger